MVRSYEECSGVEFFNEMLDKYNATKRRTKIKDNYEYNNVDDELEIIRSINKYNEVINWNVGGWYSQD